MKEQTLTQEEKLQIVEAAKAYLDAHKSEGLSQNKLAAKADINAAYISALFKGELHITSGKNIQTPIADKYFLKLAGAIGYKVQKEYWSLVTTPQFKTMIVGLDDAKKTGKNAILIGETGSGKTFSIELFYTKNPVATYRITCSALMNLSDILFTLLTQLKQDTAGSKNRRLGRIARKLKEIKMDGARPQIIFDEAENLKIPQLQMIKALYDAVKDFCSITLVGTEQLLVLLEKLRQRNKQGIPQFYRRFKAGIRNLPPIDRSYKQFLERYDLEPGLRKLICSMADNYGELNEFVEPFLREADELGQTPTEQLFRLKYDIHTQNKSFN